MTSMSAQCFIEDEGEHFEGPVWDKRNSTLYCVNITAHALVTYDVQYKTRQDYVFQDIVSAVYLTDDEYTVVLSLKDSWIKFNTLSHVQQTISSIDLPADVRFNDGKVSPSGKIYTGSMHLEGVHPTGGLYEYFQGRQQQLLEGLYISNGMAWDESQCCFYLIDSPLRTIYRFDWDLASDTISNQQVAFVFDEADGYPDGMCLDGVGHLWVAMWSGAQVCEVDMVSKTVVSRIHVPSKNVTCCVWGGMGNDTLYITTARKDTTASELKQYPLSGSIFSYTAQAQTVKTYIAQIS